MLGPSPTAKIALLLWRQLCKGIIFLHKGVHFYTTGGSEGAKAVWESCAAALERCNGRIVGCCGHSLHEPSRRAWS